MNPPWGLSACRSACFDWQGLSLCCQAFPHIGNCWRLSAEATSHPWTAAKQRTEWRGIRICRDESILTGRALISYTRGFHIKRAAGVGDLLWHLCQLSLQLSLRLQTCTERSRFAWLQSPSPGSRCSRTSLFIRLECIRRARSRE